MKKITSKFRVTTILLSVLFMSPESMADTNKTETTKSATDIITTINGTVNLHDNKPETVTHIQILNNDKLLRKKYPPLSPEMLRLYEIEHKKLPIIPPESIKMVLPNNQTCSPVRFIGFDLNGDGKSESYNMVSLLNCNGKNYVSPVRSQQGETCAAYSSSAVIESYLGVLLDSYRSNKAMDFLTINLSAGYGGSLVRALTGPGVNERSGCCISSMHDWFGTTLETYYPDSEFMALWDKTDLAEKQKKLDALSAHYSSIAECANLTYTNDINFYSQMKDCLLHAAQEKNMLFVNVDKVAQVGGNTYQQVDANIKKYIQKGHAVEASIDWSVDKAISPPDFLYQNYALRVLKPSVNKKNFGHAVAIIGYLEGLGNTQDDYWIIKNSHGDKKGQRSLFYLIQTPSTTNTTRNIFSNAGHNYRGVESLRFFKFNNNIANPIDINYSDIVRLNDSDSDGVIDFFDNCPLIENPKQEDKDGDYVGDVCDGCKDKFDLYQPMESNPLVPGNDTDGDGVLTHCDNCPNQANADQLDTDKDGQGDVCDWDDDGDGFPDNNDNCPLTYSKDQVDSDNDGIGEVCDKCPNTPITDDQDNDCLLDSVDNCPAKSNITQKDSDSDGIGDACDNCPDVNNTNGQDDYKTIRTCGSRSVRVPKDCVTNLERLYGSLCDFMRGVELNEHRLRELNVHIIKDLDPVGPPTGGAEPWSMVPNLDTIKSEQIIFKGVNEAVMKEGMKELGIRPIHLKKFKENVLQEIKK